MMYICVPIDDKLLDYRVKCLSGNMSEPRALDFQHCMCRYVHCVAISCHTLSRRYYKILTENFHLQLHLYVTMLHDIS